MRKQTIDNVEYIIIGMSAILIKVMEDIIQEDMMGNDNRRIHRIHSGGFRKLIGLQIVIGGELPPQAFTAQREFLESMCMVTGSDIEEFELPDYNNEPRPTITYIFNFDNHTVQRISYNFMNPFDIETEWYIINEKQHKVFRSFAIRQLYRLF